MATNAWKITTEEYGTLRFTDKAKAQALLRGDLDPAEAVKFAKPADDDENEDEKEEITLGDPNVASQTGRTSGKSYSVKSYKLVFGPGELLRFLQLGDDVAAELDVLADLEAPDHAAGPGGAV